MSGGPPHPDGGSAAAARGDGSAPPRVGDGSASPRASDGSASHWPEARGAAVFDTVLGRCGIAWGPAGITGVELPAPTDDELRTALADANPGAVTADPPPVVAAMIDRITDLLAGRSRDDLADIPLDMTGLSSFLRRTYTLLRTVPPGRTVTYGWMAQHLGSPGLARAVGRAMGTNPFPIIVPCHRVVAAGGAIGGFSARFGAAMKRQMLLREHAGERDEPSLFGAAELFGDRTARDSTDSSHD